jgi:hypothetical protein
VSFFKLWFGKVDKSPAQLNTVAAEAPSPVEAHTPSYSVRIASYDSLTSLPRTFDLAGSDFSKVVEDASAKVYALCREKGGSIPYIVLREALENLIHADFRDAIVTVFPDGNTVRISDHGPGISDVRRAFQPGFTTASGKLLSNIKGVGSGLPIIKESMELMGGTVTIEENLDCGCVLTISSTHVPPPASEPDADPSDHERGQEPDFEAPSRFPESSKASSSAELRKRSGDMLTSAMPASAADPMQEVQAVQSKMEQGQPKSKASGDGHELSDEAIDAALTSRQKKVFLLIAEMGEVGPSVVTKELDISLSTAYRDLVTLEELNLVVSMEGGKRKLTRRGIDFLGYIFK